MSGISCPELCWAPAPSHLPGHQSLQGCARGQARVLLHTQPADESGTTSHIVTRGQNLGVVLHVTLFLTPHCINHKSCGHCLDISLYSLPPSLLPPSLPIADQIHHCFLGLLKQPMNLSSCLEPSPLTSTLCHSYLFKMASGTTATQIDQRWWTRQAEAGCASHCDSTVTKGPLFPFLHWVLASWN